MKYTLQKTNYKNFKIFRDNILEPRSYFIPFTTSDGIKNTDIRKERYTSDMVTCLSGDWDFKFYMHSAKVPDILDTSRVNFDTVHVPSTWQRTGYLEPVYLNCPYEFKTPIPDVPEDMPAGVYRKKFTVSDTDKLYILTFLGAGTNIEVYVNGSYIGYSEGAHNTAEFNITEYLNEGENEIVVLSFKWCNGSFLEAQDMFRENGIFRDVLLSAYNKAYIYDYAVEYKKNGDKYDMKCDVEVPAYTENSTVKVMLCDGEKVIAEDKKHASQKMTFDFKSLAVTEWNAEIPYVYNLNIVLEEDGKEIMALRSITGFKNIEIKGNVFTLNGKKIKIKGVNHHDTNPIRGYAMTHDDIEQDIRLMKEMNVNSVRTSHYPPDPFFIMLCDVMGLYVIDEADIETHGLWELCQNMDAISNDLKWKHYYMDRVARMYQRDKNRASIIMWSLGNEAGGYKCQDKCYEMLKSFGTDIPVHYEGVSNTKRTGYDVVSEMYTHQDNVKKIGEGTYKGHFNGGSKAAQKIYRERPFFMCEYAHAMGVGPGAMDEYWQTIYEYDNLMGGCIWEWADHSVYHGPEDTKYKYKYTYGGDHGEKQHDRNFCVDGLMYPDRTPHTGALQMKEIYRPLKATSAGESTYCFENTNRFRNSSYLTVKWELERNGSKYDSGEINVAVEPERKETVTIETKPVDDKNDYIMSFTYLDGDIVAAKEQLVLNDVPASYTIAENGRIAIESDNGGYTVKFDGGEAVFCSKCGRLASYKKNGKEYINQNPADGKKGFTPNLFRAPLDNDCNVKGDWFTLKLDQLDFEFEIVDAALKDGQAYISTEFTAIGGRKKVFEGSIDYTVSSMGEIQVFAIISKTVKEHISLPRFGLTAEIPAEFTNVEYYGRGSHENLPDFKLQSPIGIYKSKVHDMHEPYVFPQDNGEHCEVKWIKLSDNDGHKLRIYASDRFAFNVHDYTQGNLFEAKHQEDIVKVDSTILTIDGYVRGTGTDSCGPRTLPKYEIPEDEILEFDFVMVAD